MPVPDGFAITTDAYNSFIEEKGIEEEINSLLEEAHEDLSDLNKINKISDQISFICVKNCFGVSYLLMFF